MSLRITTVSLLFVLLALQSCQRAEVYEKPIDSDILVCIYESEGNYILHAETVRYYPNLHFKIDYSFTRLGKTLKIRFNKIMYGSDFTQPERAKCDIDLGDLKSGDYSLKFNHNGQVYEGDFNTETMLLEGLGEDHPVRVLE